MRITYTLFFHPMFKEEKLQNFTKRQTWQKSKYRRDQRGENFRCKQLNAISELSKHWKTFYTVANQLMTPA